MICSSILNIRTFPQFQGEIGTRLHLGGTDTPYASLTFDDGPSPFSLVLLELLKEYDIKATFFMLGENIERYPDIATAIRDEGHCIAMHAFRHTDITSMTNQALLADIDNFEKLTSNLQIPTLNLFRPPYGEIDRNKLSLLENAGYKIALWSQDSFDWRLSAEEMMANFSKLTQLNHTYLFHDGELDGDRNATLQAVRFLIERCLRDGTVFVPQKFIQP